MTSRNLPFFATLVVFVVAWALCAAQFPAMLSTRVAANLITDNAYLGVAAVGMTFVILSGGIDLSVGSVIAFTGVFLAVTVRAGLDPIAAILLVLVITTAFGAVMGAMIHYLETPAFIVTLAGMFFARGVCFLMTTDSIPIDHPTWDALLSVSWKIPTGGRLTLIAGIMIAATLAGIVLAHLTRFGTYVYALGGNRTSAELMGVPIARTTIAIYALSGALSGLAGLVFALYTSAGYSLAATGVELDTIAAVVIGGTLLTGGVGTVAGTFVGVMIQGLIQTYIIFDGTLSSWWTKIAVGGLLFVFILLQRVLVHLAGRSRDRLVPAT